MTIEVRIRARSGDIEIEREGRVEFDDDIVGLGDNEDIEPTEARIKQIIQGLKAYPIKMPECGGSE